MDNLNLFDLKSLRIHQKRSLLATNYDNFLFKEIGRRLSNRIEDINRSFENVLEISNRPKLIREILSKNNIFTSGKINNFFSSGINQDIEINQELIPFAENSIDLAISNLTLHWANDLIGILYQIKQTLKPDGLFLASLFG